MDGSKAHFGDSPVTKMQQPPSGRRNGGHQPCS